MKAKILSLTFSLLFASTQFFGQGINLTAATPKTSVSSTANLAMNEISKAQNSQSELKGTMEIKEVLRVKLTCDAISYSDEAIVVFNDSDPTQGAAKLMSLYSTAPELWSVKNGNKYSINFLGGLDSTVIVPITLKAGVPGTYTLAASQLESFAATIQVRLEDRASGSFINLGIMPAYTFQISAPATLADRFYIHFVDLTSVPGKEITSVTDISVARSFNVCAVDGAISVTSLQQQSGKIAVFDMNGRKMATGRVDAGANTRLDMHGNTGVYIVSVLTGKGKSNTKILIR